MALPQPTLNRLLAAAIASGEAEPLTAGLERVELELEEVLAERDEPVGRIWFPETCVISAITRFREGGLGEMATVGREGLVGLAAALGGGGHMAQALVQMRGLAVVGRAEALREALDRSARLRALFGAYAEAFLSQVMQSVACNAAHDVSERCARWLLMTQDRSGGDTFPLTQEYLARMLNVHRPTVTLAASSLQRAGLIRYTRGAVTVTHRPGLEDAACECYGEIRRQFERRLPYRFA